MMPGPLRLRDEERELDALNGPSATNRVTAQEIWYRRSSWS